MGTTARSCNSSTENTPRPMGEPSSWRWRNSCITTAVDENARTKPCTTAEEKRSSSIHAATPAITSAVSTICATPTPNTHLRKASSR